jgi:hypothetical protein
MLRPWNPQKEEIESWLITKELEFAQKDNRNPRLTPHKHLEKYMFTDLHKVFFYDFPHLLQEWILLSLCKFPEVFRRYKKFSRGNLPNRFETRI